VTKPAIHNQLYDDTNSGLISRRIIQQININLLTITAVCRYLYC